MHVKCYSNNSLLYLFSGEGNGIPLQYSCLENPMVGGAWWDAVHGVAKSRTWLSDFTFTFHFHALEKEMATHSSVLAWRIPGMGEPGGLPSMESHRVGQDWSDLAAAAAAKYLQLCSTLCHPMDYRNPGSSVHEFSSKNTEMVAVPSSMVSSQPRGQTWVSFSSCITGRIFTAEPPGKPNSLFIFCLSLLSL